MSDEPGEAMARMSNAVAKGRVVLPGVARLAFRGPTHLSRPASPPAARERRSPARSLKVPA